MLEAGNPLSPDKIRALLQAGEQQLSPEDFEQLQLLLSDLAVYGFTPWINAELGKLMAKIEWELVVEPSPEWQPALQACDYAFLGEELKRMCSDAGVSLSGHKKELCARLYLAGVPEVVKIMAPYFVEQGHEKFTTEELGERWNRMTPMEREQLGIKAGLNAEERGSRWIELWPEKKRAIRRAFEKTGEATTRANPQKYIDVGKTRRVKDRLEELLRSDPKEFYRRRKIILQAIEEREKGKKIKTMPDFTLEELKDILKEADMLYR